MSAGTILRLNQNSMNSNISQLALSLCCEVCGEYYDTVYLNQHGDNKILCRHCLSNFTSDFYENALRDDICQCRHNLQDHMRMGRMMMNSCAHMIDRFSGRHNCRCDGFVYDYTVEGIPF